MTFTPAYMMAGYGSYEEYLMSDEWQAKKEGITKRYPKSKYCWICDTTTYLNLHHENYWAIPKEKFLKDVFWLCRDCHHKTHLTAKATKQGTGERTPLEIEDLRARRLALRKAHIARYFRASTIFYFIGRAFYRWIW